MAKVKHEAAWYPLEPEETVLDGLLRQGVNVPHSCRAGACQSCLMRAVEGTVPPASQVGLKDTLRARNYFLACACKLPADAALEVAGVRELRIPASIVALESLSPDVLSVRLETATPLDYRAGQYVSLVRADGLARSYSLASLPREGTLELHVRLIPGGAMSGWLARDVRPGERVEIQGPAGDCFYVPGQPEAPLLLAGTGTGLAPLYGIVRDALEAGHTGPIHLLHGARDPGGLYLVDRLREWAAWHPNVHYWPSVLAGGGGDIQEGTLEALVLARLPKRPTGWRAFLCGNAEGVLSLRKKLFLAGFSLKDIHADAFLPSAPPAGRVAGAA
ncbi:2Fe-2S iron-sulfur cluster binding domain-containing protein [Corallococcus sp. ZKHCc1 1396]|uniref:2Fe-2S iron-sulfur cluster binding domain-containing protein n=1 Tax=Corallococcus soli TaxID=2710757 RepID=A0ABR9PJM4_9BACT|nr:2Fe-2S iron-sulfur cluster-binding protein [Corallococcus soli]MBE4748137.1 2Fe-2S iron-sulfur cluster binding domain-containing protein [Corallococcus soli]